MDSVAKEGRPKFNPRARRPGRALNPGPRGWPAVRDLTNCANLAHSISHYHMQVLSHNPRIPSYYIRDPVTLVSRRFQLVSKRRKYKHIIAWPLRPM